MRHYRHPLRRHRLPRHMFRTGRQRAIAVLLLTAFVLSIVVLAGYMIDDSRLATRPELRHQAPSLDHWFGTDWLGRDMFLRTVKGLAISIQAGVIAAAASTLIAAVMGMLAALRGRFLDRMITWLIDFFLSVPHLVTLILIAYISGGGLKGVVLGIALTHWPSLARVIRAEAWQLKSAEFVQISRKLGRSRRWIAVHHILPHLVPQIMIGFVLMFPHAILHEASITFLGLGLSPHQPAIGIILNESMQYLSTGSWWLAIFPGAALVIVVRLFSIAGEKLRQWFDPDRVWRR
jgi:peptide/nickel transport system permease protein